MELSGRRVLITGASRGIGQALAERFTAAGARVALVARSEGPLKELAARLGGTAHPTDLGDRDAVAGLIDRIEAEGGPVDVLVNNAGVDMTGSFLKATADDVEALYRLNLITPVELCRQVVPRMLGRGGGHVVNVSSVAGVAAFPGMALYASSKAGLSHFTAMLRLDLRGLPIGVTLVEPGPVPTEMFEASFGYQPTNESWNRTFGMHLTAEVPPATLAGAVVDAVARGKRHVRLPRRLAPFALLAETPRRVAELILTGIKHQED